MVRLLPIFIMLFVGAAFGQSPGGVTTDLSLWYKGDKGVTIDAGKFVTQWVSSSANGVTLTPSGAAILPYNDQTTYTRTFNFNPTITFDGTNNYLRNTSTAYLNSAGSVHYIVVAKGTNRSTATRSLFSILGNDDGFFYSGAGGNTAFPTIGNNFNSTAAAITSVEDFGIYSAILPKTAVQGTQRGFYNGLKKNYPSPYPYTGGSYSLPTTGAFIGADGTTGNNFLGDIAEVILYHNTGGADLIDANLEKIHSYLAVKYGITLTSTQNYLTSLNQVVWNAAANTGYTNNIFGVGRDNGSDLHQKQSKSTNTAQKLVIGNASTLFSTNALNTNALTEGQFLLVGDNGLKQSLTVPFAYTAGSNGTANYRFESIWRVQNSNGVGTVTVAWPKSVKNLYLVQSSDAFFDGTDTFTAMITEVTVNGVVYNTVNVTLANGQFFTFAGFANAPGGVAGGLSYWYRADKNNVNTGAATDVTGWTDMWSGTTVAKLGTNALPKYVLGTSAYFNFNPGINFTAVTQTLGNNTVRTLTSLNYDVFTFTKEGLTDRGGNPRLFSTGMDNVTMNDQNWDGFGIFPATTNLERRPYGGGTQFPGVAPAFSGTIPSIMYFRNTNISTSKGLNGASMATSTAYSPVGSMFGGHVFGDTRFSSNGSDNAGFIGHIGEAIVYGAGTLSNTERRKVDSYLAIKYGITLGQVATEHYLDTEGNMVWNGSANTTYNNNIFGVSRDDTEAFHQKVSKSVNSGTILTIATTADFINPNQDLTRKEFANDKTYFMLGDNNNFTAAPLVNITLAGSAGYHIPRIWLSQRSNTPGVLSFEANLAAYGSLFTAGNNVYMLVADNAAFTVNVAQVPGSFTGGKWVFSYNFNSNAALRYITFAQVLTPVQKLIITNSMLPSKVQ